MLSCSHLHKTYGEKTVLADISFDVHPGEIVALLGKNGAGKTTTLNCITGITHPTGGEITWQGRSVLPESPDRASFGVLITAVFFDYLNVEDNLTALLRAHGVRDRAEIRRRIDAALTLVDLAGQKRKLVKTFSLGMKQRLGLAQALLHDSAFIMLDEPLIGLDPIGRKIVKEMLVRQAKQQGLPVLFSSHELGDVADICDRIVMIKDGLVAFDGPYTDDSEYELVTARPLVGGGGAPDAAPAGDASCTTVVRDLDELNTLIAAGSFADNPIRGLRVHENALFRLFQD